MHKIKMSQPYPCSAEKAYDISVDDYEGAEEYLPNIQSMETLDVRMTEDGHEIRTFRFRARSPIPKVAQSIFKPEMLQWDQELTLFPERLHLDWKVMPHYYTEYIHCYGGTDFRDNGKKSVVEVRGVLRLDPMPIPGIPEAVVLQVIKVVEPFIGALITPNLRKFYKSIIRMASDAGKL